MVNKMQKKTDLLIGGGAYVGLTLAIAVKQAVPHLDVTVVDSALKDAWKNDPRASAIAAAPIRMLKKLDCWADVEPVSEPIKEMIITDSRNSDPVRPVFLTFSGDVNSGEPFAYMVENKYLNGSLRKRAHALGINLIEETRITGFENKGDEISVVLDKDKKISAQLLVGADGTHSKLRDMSGIKKISLPYHQMGIVCTVEHERPHNGQAIEHFLPAGPFAILPMKGNRSLLVWNENEAETKRLFEADNMIFEAALELRFGHYLGALKIVGEKYSFPFCLTLARDFVRPRFALAGDAAHSIHPITGQGLNLGLCDVACLAQTIVETARLGLDIGGLTELERYQSWRRFETVRTGVATDVLNRMFSNDIAPLRAIRDFGLGLVDRMPKLKKHFISEAAGVTKNTPKLFLGEAI